MLNRINHVLTNVEKVFNVIDCMPYGIGMISGAIRFKLGKIQMIAGAAIAGVGLVGQLVGEDKYKWKQVTRLGVEHMIHGGLNSLRGLGTVLLGAATLGFGNLCLLIPNIAKDDPFSPEFKYGTFTSKPRFAF